MSIEEDIMSEEAFNELIDNFEVVEKITMFGRKSIKYYVKKMQAEREQDKKRMQELEKEKKRKDMFMEMAKEVVENSILKQKVKEVLQNNRNELFGMTCLSKEQYRPYEMQIERINKIEKELLEGERK